MAMQTPETAVCVPSSKAAPTSQSYVGQALAGAIAAAQASTVRAALRPWPAEGPPRTLLRTLMAFVVTTGPTLSQTYLSVRSQDDRKLPALVRAGDARRAIGIDAGGRVASVPLGDHPRYRWTTCRGSRDKDRAGPLDMPTRTAADTVSHRLGYRDEERRRGRFRGPCRRAPGRTPHRHSQGHCYLEKGRAPLAIGRSWRPAGGLLSARQDDQPSPERPGRRDGTRCDNRNATRRRPRVGRGCSRLLGTDRNRRYDGLARFNDVVGGGETGLPRGSA